LLAEGWHVVCVDNLLTGSAANLSQLEGNPAFRFLRHDVSQPLYLDDPIHAVLHFASSASPVDYARHPIATLKVGTLGTHNLLGLARAKQAVFLLASTSEVYGDPQVNPQPESYWGNVNPVGPRGVYDEAKRAAEAFTMAYHRTHGLQTRIARIFNTYGPRMRLHDGRAVPAFITQALRGEPITVYGNGAQTRSLCYVDDLVDGIVGLLGRSCSDPVNLGNPEEVTVLDLAKRIRNMCGSKSPIEHRPLPEDDPRTRRPDIRRAQDVLGWQPTVRLDEGLRRTIAWFRAH
jgi:dTDP-glucose 4,6-dehydratase